MTPQTGSRALISCSSPITLPKHLACPSIWQSLQISTTGSAVQLLKDFDHVMFLREYSVELWHAS